MNFATDYKEYVYMTYKIDFMNYDLHNRLYVM